MLTSTKKTVEFRAIMGSGASICMCGAPSRAGTQNGPEVLGPCVEMTRKPRYHEVGISHKKTSQLRDIVVRIVQAQFLRRLAEKCRIGAECHTLHHGRRPHGFHDTHLSSRWHAEAMLFLISARWERMSGRRQLRHGCTITARIAPLRYRCSLAESSHLTTCLGLFRPSKLRQST